MQKEQMSISQRWGELFFPQSVQYVKLCCFFDQNGAPNPKFLLTLHVHNQMTIRQLIQMYKLNLQMKEDQFLQRDRKLVYDQTLLLGQNSTIRQFKNIILLDKLSGQLLKLYNNQYNLLKLQGCLEYQKFEEKYGNEIAEFAVKFQHQRQSSYFYLKEPRKILINQFIKKLTQSIRSLGVQRQENQNIILQYQVSKKEQQRLKKYQINQQKNKRYIFLQEFPNLRVREFVKYGQTVILKYEPNWLHKAYLNITTFFKGLAIQEKQHQIQDKVEEQMIKIQIYVGNASQFDLKNLTQSFDKEKKIISIKIPYKNAKGMKVRTLLKENEVPNFLQISLINANILLKPIETFSKIEECKLKFQNNCLKFVGITQNFLFYKQIRTFSNFKNKNMQYIYQELQKRPNNPIREQQRKNCVQKVSEIKKKMTEFNIDKKQEFLHPIVLYTSDLIYHDLNEFARETSTSHFDIHSMAKYWQYSFMQKLINSLQKIPNFHGTVYRGVKETVFSYKQGDIIEFNSFTSTSKTQSIAKTFQGYTKNKNMFKIQTFSGKQIGKFSYTSIQNEVLLFPYTKFKVLRSQKIGNVHQMDLLQIPVPKRIPGDIVVWIDANIVQNSKIFIQTTQKNKIRNLELIQLSSNDHLQCWIRQFKPILDLHDVNIHFITNLNRPPNYNAQGIQTLRIIRRLRQQTEVVFYIGSIKNTWQKIKFSEFSNDNNIKVCNLPKDLQSIICQWKRQLQQSRLNY